MASIWSRPQCVKIVPHINQHVIAISQGPCLQRISNPIWTLRHGSVMTSINTLRPGQNGRHSADDIFKCIFLNENAWIPIKISLKFVPKGPINNIPALVQIMLGTNQAASHYLNQWWLVYWRIYASVGLNELRHGSVMTSIKIMGCNNSSMTRWWSVRAVKVRVWMGNYMAHRKTD